MDYTGRVSVTIAVGIALALLYARRTGWSAGGLVSPGLLAIQIASPGHFFGVLLLSLFFAALLRPLARLFGLFGRERVGVVLLIAIAFRLLFKDVTDGDLWLGWIAPGLIAADIERQGTVTTLAAVISVSIAAAFLTSLFMLALGRLA